MIELFNGKCGVCGEVFKDAGASSLGGLIDAFAPIFFGPLGTIHPDGNSDKFKQLFGIYNHREKKANWICGACLAEKLGIEEERKPRGGMF